MTPMSYSTPRSALDIASSRLDETLDDYFGSTGAVRALQRHMLRRQVCAVREMQNAAARRVKAALWEWAFASTGHARKVRAVA
jgi:hypothetical protein